MSERRRYTVNQCKCALMRVILKQKGHKMEEMALKLEAQKLLDSYNDDQLIDAEIRGAQLDDIGRKSK